MSLTGDERDSSLTSAGQLDGQGRARKDRFDTQAHPGSHSVCCKSICGWMTLTDVIETQSCQAVFSAHLPSITRVNPGRALRASGQTPPVTPWQTLESRQHSSVDSPTSTPLRDCSNSECKRLLPAQCTIFEEGDRQFTLEGASASKIENSGTGKVVEIRQSK